MEIIIRDEPIDLSRDELADLAWQIHLLLYYDQDEEADENTED